MNLGILEKFSTRPRHRPVIWSLALVLAVGGVYYALDGKGNAHDPATAGNQQGGRPSGGAGGPDGGRNNPGSGLRGNMANRPQAIKATAVRQGDLDVVLTALGTVTASNTAIVRPRVEGQLVRIHFREGQQVKTGDLLAEIDPRPFRIQLEQAQGQLTRDSALLAAARVDLERYRNLLAQDSIARQQVDTQEALVRQYQGVVETDQAQVDNARLQLEFSRVTAPASGKLGLRQVDVGNNIRASDANGIVVITETQPIHILFSIPAESLGGVIRRFDRGETLSVEAWDRDGQTRLATGRLVSLDNQIDASTGALKLKAEFANKDNSLLPNQFVNIRLNSESRVGSLLLSTAAIQRNAEGSYVYHIDQKDASVKTRPVRLGVTSGEYAAIEAGLRAGDLVVLDGADRLRDGGKVDIISIDGAAATDSRLRNSEGDKGYGIKSGAEKGGAEGGEQKIRPRQS
ncbi:MAG: MdtA/MuxA family multidrug efflux RND transporter periplasmic adaptor subunit [Zoogloeaceae bacterium]|jgi:multidrug efflux system membrane fusion protein|nr:MdtA/MuxA family multidrug efflux RND transporter periplasmic adaptor subunit [Zoogloeaceae bacterium]